MKSGELRVVLRLLDMPFTSNLITDDADIRLFGAAYGAMLERTDPSEIDLLLSITLLRHVYMLRHIVGQQWLDFRDRVRAHIETNCPDKNADSILQGL